MATIKTIKNTNGIALALVIMVMAVTTIFGATVLTLMLSDMNLAENQEYQLQAEYIARAGAEAAGKYVQDHPSSYPPNGFSSQTFTGVLGEGSFSAQISRPAQDNVLISSVGTVNGVTQTVYLHLLKQSYNSTFSGVRQTAQETVLKLGALAIYHDAGVAVSIEGNVINPETDIILSSSNPSNASDPNIIRSANYDFAGDLVLPSDYEENLIDQADIKTGDITTITGDTYLETLTKGNNETIIFDTQGDIQTVVDDDLDFGGSQGTVDIIGDGTVHLYIINSASLDNPMNMNGGLPSQLFIYVNDGATLSLQSNCELAAYIYAPNATIEIQSSQTTIYGAMVGNILQRVNYTQGPLGEFHYVPLTDNVDYEGFLAYVKDYYSN